MERSELSKLNFAKILGVIPDKLYLSMIYRIRIKKRMNWDNPQSYNEKTQWIKVHYRNPLYNKLVDKFEMKEYVSEKIGREHVVPTLGLYNSAEDIELEKFPDQFVLKCTHDSGSVEICKNKNNFNFQSVKKSLEKCLKTKLLIYTGSQENGLIRMSNRELLQNHFCLRYLTSNWLNIRFFASTV